MALTAVQRQERRARVATFGLVSLSFVIVLVSAYLLFNPLIRAPGFGFVPYQRVVTVTSTATVLVYAQTPVPTVGPPQTTPAGGKGKPATPTPRSQPTPTLPPIVTPTTPNLPTATPTFTPTPLPTATPRPTATPTPTPTWHPVLTQSVPACNNPSGADWFSPDPATLRSQCQGSQLMMQQIGTHYGELDLSDNKFSYTRLREQVSVHFPNPGDTNTWAILLAQTPKPANQFGGMNLEIASNGNWLILQTITANQFLQLGSGHVNINASGETTLTIVVQNGSLFAYINGSFVGGTSDNLNPNPGACGLLVRTTHAIPSSQVMFQNFEYDSWY